MRGHGFLSRGLSVGQAAELRVDDTEVVKDAGKVSPVAVWGSRGKVAADSKGFLDQRQRIVVPFHAAKANAEVDQATGQVWLVAVRQFGRQFTEHGHGLAQRIQGIRFAAHVRLEDSEIAEGEAEFWPVAAGRLASYFDLKNPRGG